MSGVLSTSKATRFRLACKGEETNVRDLLMAGRHRKITEFIEERGQATVAELASTFQRSEVTIRSDLEALAARGAILRSHGGAVRRRDSDETPIAVKQLRQREEKARIAAAAIELLVDGEVVILDSGTTTEEIARRISTLKFKSLTVITNALNVAVILASVPFVQVIMLGGILRPSTHTLGGLHSEHALENLRATKLFLGVDSLHTEVGLMTAHLLEAALNAKMISAASEVIAVADSSKLQTRSVALIAKVSAMHVLITDTAADAVVVESLRSRGIRVLCV